MKTLIIALAAGAAGVFCGLLYSGVINVAILKAVGDDEAGDPGGGFGEGGWPFSGQWPDSGTISSEPKDWVIT